MCFFQPDNKGRGSWTLSLIQDLTPCPIRIAAARMANNIMAALMRKRRHQRNQPNKIKCVMTPQGWVTVSVTQKAALVTNFVLQVANASQKAIRLLA